MEKLTYPIAYDFEAVCRYYARDPLFRVSEAEITLLLPGGRLGGLRREKEGPVLLGEDLTQDREALERIFQLKDERRELLNAYADSELATLLESYRDLPLLLEPSPELALYRAVLHQQVSMSAAYTVTRRLIERFGPEREGLYTMPSAATLATISFDDYRALGLNGGKSATMLCLSAALSGGELRLPSEVRTEEEYRELGRLLTAYKGIGPWSVQCVALFGYGYPHLVPEADLGLQEALKRWYGLEQRPDREWLRDWAAAHLQGGSYLTFYLWQWLRGQAAVAS